LQRLLLCRICSCGVVALQPRFSALRGGDRQRLQTTSRRRCDGCRCERAATQRFSLWQQRRSRTVLLHTSSTEAALAEQMSVANPLPVATPQTRQRGGRQTGKSVSNEQKTNTTQSPSRFGVSPVSRNAGAAVLSSLPAFVAVRCACSHTEMSREQSKQGHNGVRGAGVWRRGWLGLDGAGGGVVSTT
jgi:hypothetical protein